MMEGDTKLCPNCKKDISTSNYVMHEMHCRRHIILCKHCGEPIPRVELDQHFNDVHAKVPCERCKQQFARNEIESHMERDCSKKPMMCEFCELSFPRSEYDGHIGYCGSRTECCPLCQQYIMFKDKTLHEASDCLYPEPKPIPSQPAPNSDPFSMAHLHDFLEVDSQYGRSDDIPDFTANLRRELQRLDEVGAPQNVPSQTRRSRNTVSERPSGIDAVSNLRRQRDSNNGALNNMWEAIPPDMDYDSLLALQMAHEDWAEDNGVSAGEEQRGMTSPLGFDLVNPPLSTATDGDSQPREELEFRVEDGDLTIPCEFCEMEIPMSMYMDHVEDCTLSDAVTSNDLNYVDRNNELPISTSGSQRSAIPVINNLRSERQHRQLEPPDSTTFVEDVILPCEFCEDMFPAEIIVQHQSVCPANGMATPREVTPASGLRSKPPSQHTNAASGSSVSTANKSSEDGFSDDDGPQSNFFRDSSYKDMLQSKSDKYQPSVDRFDNSIARPPRRSSRQFGSEKGQENVRNSTCNPQTQRPSKSAQRTRASLNQLLQENADVGARPPSRGAHRSQRGRSSGVSRGTTGMTDRRRAGSSQVDSRTVMRELDRVQPSVTRGATRRPLQSPRNPRNSIRGAETSTRGHQGASSTSSVTTNRQSRNQIFSPELRLNPDHNPPRRRR